jgi:hypothetical protein
MAPYYAMAIRWLRREFAGSTRSYQQSLWIRITLLHLGQPTVLSAWQLRSTCKQRLDGSANIKRAMVCAQLHTVPRSA